jgi:hypothetical protein
MKFRRLIALAAGLCLVAAVPLFLSRVPGLPPPVVHRGPPLPWKDKDITQDAPCRGTEINVSYNFVGPDSQSPFECDPFCANRQYEAHYILYANGYGAQCGLSSCKDYGEDLCISCTVPEEVRARYHLPVPTDPVPCLRAASSSSDGAVTD